VAGLEQVGDVFFQDGAEASTDGGLNSGCGSSTRVVRLAAFLQREQLGLSGVEAHVLAWWHAYC
jgi:hypothetical protein